MFLPNNFKVLLCNHWIKRKEKKRKSRIGRWHSPVSALSLKFQGQQRKYSFQHCTDPVIASETPSRTLGKIGTQFVCNVYSIATWNVTVPDQAHVQPERGWGGTEREGEWKADSIMNVGRKWWPPWKQTGKNPGGDMRVAQADWHWCQCHRKRGSGRETALWMWVGNGDLPDNKLEKKNWRWHEGSTSRLALVSMSQKERQHYECGSQMTTTLTTNWKKWRRHEGSSSTVADGVSVSVHHLDCLC